MTTSATAITPYTFTLSRQIEPGVQPTPGVVTGGSPLPLTAGSELHVSAVLRRTSWQMADAYPSLEPVESLCLVERLGQAAETHPGVVVFDHRFPIWLAVFEDEAFISVDTELADGSARQRFVATSRYVCFLVDLGYSIVVDHRLHNVVAVGSDGQAIVERLAHAGGSRLFDRLRMDRRFGFVGSVVGVSVADIALNLWQGQVNPL